MLKELELGLERRDFPGELFVLDDELLEEGDYAFVGLMCFHVSDEWCVRNDRSDDGMLTSDGANYPRAGKGGGR